MGSFLQYFILFWLYLILIFIFIGIIILLIKNRHFIFYKVRHKKKILLLLLILVMISSLVKINIYHPKLIIGNSDSSEYLIESEAINSYHKFIFVCDPPGYPTLISLIQKLGIIVNASFVLNLAASILSIFLIFLFVQLLFGNYRVSALSSVLFSFSYMYTGSTVIGFPMPVSIFFFLIALISVIIAVNKNELSAYILTGLSLGFAFHLSYIELIFFIIILVYIFLNKGLKFLLNPRLYLILALFLISILPFVLLQQVSSNAECITYSEYPRFQEQKDPLCKIMRNYCGLYSFKYLFRNSEIKESFVNDANGNLPSYLSFLFLGYGVKDFNYILQAWELLDKYTFDYSSLLTSFFIVLALCYNVIKKVRIKETYFLLLFLLIYLILISLYYSTLYLLILPVEILFKIPLACLGIHYLLKIIRNRILGWIILIMLLFIFLSSIFIHFDFTQPRFTSENFKKEIFCNRYASYKEPCYSLLKKFIEHEIVKYR